MADTTNTTTEILKFEIETGNAIPEQEKIKTLLLQIKQEQVDLQKAYKAGAITLQEYSAESVRVENNQKKLASSYSNIQRSVTGLNNPIKELTKSNQNLSNTMKDLGANLNVGGVSITNVTGKLAQFASPAGIAVGLVSALGAAYASSTVGAKDLEFAQNELGFAFQSASNKLGELISNGKDGEGFFTRITDLVVGAVGGLDTLVNSKVAALGIEKLQDSERELLKLRAASSDRLQDNQDLLTKINDSQTSYNDKVKAFAQIEANLKINRDEQVANLNEQISILEQQKPLVKDDEAIEGQINAKILERSQLLKGINRLMQSNERLASNTADAESKAFSDLGKKLKFKAGSAESGAQKEDFGEAPDAQEERQDASLESREKYLEAGRQQEADSRAQDLENQGGYVEAVLSKEQYLAQNRTEINKMYYQQSSKLLSGAAQFAAQVFGKQSLAFRAIASAQALVQSFLGAQEAFTSLASIPYVGSILGGIAAAAALASGLANVAAINNVKFAEGGYTGSGGKYDPAGIVHRGEYVVPQHVMQNPAYSGHITALESARLGGYAMGGAVTQAATARFDGQLMIQDMIKSVPAPVLDLRELSIEQNRIAIKENITQV